MLFKFYGSIVIEYKISKIAKFQLQIYKLSEITQLEMIWDDQKVIWKIKKIKKQLHIYECNSTE